MGVDDFAYLSAVFSPIVKFLAGQGTHDLDVNDGFLSVAFSPDGKTLATGSRHDIRIWDVATGTKKGTLVGQPGEIVSLAFSPDGKNLGFRKLLRICMVVGCAQWHTTNNRGTWVAERLFGGLPLLRRLQRRW